MARQHRHSSPADEGMRIADASARQAAQELADDPARIEEFRAYAAGLASHMSLRNVLAPFAQDPAAVQVRTARQWAAGGRSVPADATPLWTITSRAAGNRRTFHARPVYDIASTVNAGPRPCDGCGARRSHGCHATCPRRQPGRGPKPQHAAVNRLVAAVLGRPLSHA